MRSKVLSLLAVLAGLAFSASPGAAQFAPGYTGIGPTVGLGNIGGAGIAVGGRFEHGIEPIPDLGKGTLSFEASVDFYSWNCGGVGFTCNVRYVPFGATANWNFVLSSMPKLDPFLGLGLGYRIVSCDFNGAGGCGYSSALYAIGRAGARYFLTPQTALYGDLGAGAAVLNVGVMFGMH